MSAHLIRCLCCLGGMLLGPALVAQGASGPPPGPALGKSELDALVGPVALYPDLVLSHVIEASKDPAALVAAGDLLGKPGGDIKPEKSWPGAVKVLMHVPSVLQMLDSSLSWTTRLGNAEKRSPQELLAAVQRVRRKAKAAGNLVSDDKQKVVESGDLLKIELADPSVLYVPQYDPSQLFDGHESDADSDPWFTYGPAITITGYKNVATGLASLEYVHRSQVSHHHYYGDGSHDGQARPHEVYRVHNVYPWRGYGFDHHGHGHGHGGHHHHH